MNGQTLLRSLSISKADLVRVCLQSGLPVFGLDILRREFTVTELEIVRKELDKSPSANRNQTTKERSKKQSAIKKKSQTPIEFAQEFEIDLEVILQTVNALGFNIRNGNYRLSHRQRIILEEKLIKGELLVAESPTETNGGVTQNIVIANALKEVLERREAVSGRSLVREDLKPSKLATAKRLSLVAKEFGLPVEQLLSLCSAFEIPLQSTRKTIKIELRHIDELQGLVQSFQAIQHLRSDEDVVRISKIARIFNVRARDVRDLCEQKGIPVRSERFLANEHEFIVLMHLHLRRNELEAPQPKEDAPTDEPLQTDMQLVDYSGISLIRQHIVEYDFSNSLLRGVDFSHSSITKVNFNNSHLENSVFVRAIFRNTTFTSSRLNSSQFDYVVADGVNFDNSTLTQSSFVRAKLRNCSFVGADLTDCDFSDSTIEDCRFPDEFAKDTTWVAQLSN